MVADRASRIAPRQDVASAALAFTSPEAIVTMDSDRRIIAANPATERLFGYSSDEIVGRQLSALIPERPPMVSDANASAYDGVERRATPWAGRRAMAVTKHAGEVPVEVVFGAFVDAEGHRLISGFIRDVSERVRHEQELDAVRESHAQERRQALELSERRRAEAEAALKSRDDVLSVVSHDLRNPLNTIVMSATMLQDVSLHLPEVESRHLVDIIARSARRMNRLIQDLHDVGRIETGRFSVNCQPVKSADVVRDVCEEFGSVIEQHGQTFIRRIAADAPIVWIDRDRVVQLLSNYLSNAVKFTPAGGRIGVELSVDRRGAARFAVSDSGPGLDDAALEHIFDGFWQAERTAHLGAGLGLAIARGIAAAHGGRVWAESTVGEGSTFYFELPPSPDGAPPSRRGAST